MSKNTQHLASLFFYCVSVWLRLFLPLQFLFGNQPAGRSLITELAELTSSALTPHETRNSYLPSVQYVKIQLLYFRHDGDLFGIMLR